MTSSLLNIPRRFPGRRVVVIGDLMLDRYVYGDAERISPEAPVPVLRVVQREDRVGGAGSVALNIQSLGAQAECLGIVGRDRFGQRIREMLAAAGAETGGIFEVHDRPTITKTRLVGLAEHRHRQQILRVDDEVVRPIDPQTAAKLLERYAAALPRADVVCLEDYAKGLLADGICQRLINQARAAGKPVVVDPGRTRGWERYRGATLLTPNRAELAHAVGHELSGEQIAEAATTLTRELELTAMVVTLGRDGALLVRPDGYTQHFPTRPRAVYDNTGAGDAVLAMIAVAIACGATLEEAVQLANVAGGLEVSKFGCVPIRRDEVVAELRATHDTTRRKVRPLDELLAELSARRQRGETVVLTNGCFDLLHPGHVELLERARALGSLLVVGLNSDASVRAQNKGDDRPVRCERDRARMLAALEAVDYVVLFDEPSVAPLVERIRPDVLVKGGDYQPHEVVGHEIVRGYGGRVVVLDFIEGYSTTGELERIRGSAGSRV